MRAIDWGKDKSEVGKRRDTRYVYCLNCYVSSNIGADRAGFLGGRKGGEGGARGARGGRTHIEGAHPH